MCFKSWCKIWVSWGHVNCVWFVNKMFNRLHPKNNIQIAWKIAVDSASNVISHGILQAVGSRTWSAQPGLTRPPAQSSPSHLGFLQSTSELSLSLSALIIFKQLYTLCSSLLATPKPGLTSLGKTRDKAHHLKDIRPDNLIRAHKVLKWNYRVRSLPSHIWSWEMPD